MFLLLLVTSFAEEWSQKASFYLTVTILGGALAAASFMPMSHSDLLTPWLKFDALSHFFTLFFLGIGLGATLLGASFFYQFEAVRAEFYILLLSAVFGLILIGAAADFLTLFIGIETLSLSLYILCGYMKRWQFSQEASMKYFFMGALAAGFLLYGIALIYGAIGTTRLDQLVQGYQGLHAPFDRLLFFSGIAFITVGLAFEAALVPFHLWAPDVYAGAPTPIAGFMSVGTKGGAFAAFTRVFLESLPNFDPLWSQALSFIAYATLIYANLVALRQIEMRRFFAYSGISHAGFLLIPFVAMTADSLNALCFYLVVYTIATFGSFAVLAFLDHHQKGVQLSDLHGLYYRSPFLALVLSFSLLTLAGIPPTAGFFAKLYLFKVAFEMRDYGLVVVGLLTTVLSAYYYLRLVGVLFTRAPQERQISLALWPSALLGIFSLALMLALTLYPHPLLERLPK